AWVPCATGAALAACYAAWAASSDQPALDLSLARQRVPALAIGLSALASVVTWAAVFLLPVFVQSVQGRSALAAGLALPPQAGHPGVSAALGPRLLTRFTVRATVLAGFAILAAGSLGVLLIGTSTPLWLIAAILACRSVSIGLVITPLLLAMTEPLEPAQMGDANTLFNVWQRIAGSFGISLRAPLRAARLNRRAGPRAAPARPGHHRPLRRGRPRRARPARHPQHRARPHVTAAPRQTGQRTCACRLQVVWSWAAMPLH